MTRNRIDGNQLVLHLRQIAGLPQARQVGLGNKIFKQKLLYGQTVAEAAIDENFVEEDFREEFEKMYFRICNTIFNSTDEEEANKAIKKAIELPNCLKHHFVNNALNRQEMMFIIRELQKRDYWPLYTDQLFCNTLLHQLIANSCEEAGRFRNSTMRVNIADRLHMILEALTKKYGDVGIVKPKEKKSELAEILDAQDIFGHTPLVIAMMTRNYNTAKKLIKMGANPNVNCLLTEGRYSQKDGVERVFVNDITANLTPLHIAYIVGDPELIEMIEDQYANSSTKVDKECTVCRYDYGNPPKRTDINLQPKDFLKSEHNDLRLFLLESMHYSCNLFHGHLYKDSKEKFPEHDRNNVILKLLSFAAQNGKSEQFQELCSVIGNPNENHNMFKIFFYMQ